MTPTVERRPPPYLQIAQAIEEDITSGKLTEGEKVPSVREIAASWDVAMATATKVLQHLRQRGLVRVTPGVGTVVAICEESPTQCEDGEPPELPALDYTAPIHAPATGQAVPESVVPRDELIASILLDAVGEWWSSLTPEQHVGLWVRYSPNNGGTQHAT